MVLILKLLAPYFAVGVFWIGLENAWLSILAYHAQILFWSRDWAGDPRRGIITGLGASALPAVLAGPLIYLLLPHITRIDVSPWLATHHLNGTSLLLMIPYFGLVHPLLEQLHWDRLRERTPVSHPLFAGYHVLVLGSLLNIPWLIVCFGVLTGASIAWGGMRRRSSGLGSPIASHVLADLGIVIAAWVGR